MLRELETRGKYERGGWPAQPRPDLKPPEGWSLALITSIGRPRSHSPSPDGSQIAFIWDRSDASNIYLISLDGGWPRRMPPARDAKPYWLDESPQWSPDGRFLAFTDKGHSWLVAVDGGLPQKITSFTRRATITRWMTSTARTSCWPTSRPVLPARSPRHPSVRTRPPTGRRRDNASPTPRKGRGSSSSSSSTRRAAKRNR